MNEIRISLLHVALEPGALAKNVALVEMGIKVAAAKGTQLVVAPELCISGYEFREVIGVDWIAISPDEWTRRIQDLASSLKIATIFGHAERDEYGQLYNSAFVIDASGALIGKHRKRNTVTERWAHPGEETSPITWNGLRLGILICADAYTRDVAAALSSKGAQILISPANWGPGENGPKGEWQERTTETGLPMVVCNRTGRERLLDFSGAESLVIERGHRLLAHSSPRSAVLTFDWSLERMRPSSTAFEIQML